MRALNSGFKYRSLIPAAAARDRRAARRRCALGGGLFAVVLFVAGLMIARSSSGLWHLLGILCVGYGIGIAGAAAFLASGYERPRRK